MTKMANTSLACTILNQDGVVALPTDTLYGFAAKASSTKAIERIYQIKQRDHNTPLAICVSNIDQIYEVAETGHVSQTILQSLFPGPITLVLKRSKNLNKDLNPGMDTIGVRVPDYKFIRTISEIVGPLALTSANKSGETSPLDVSDFQELWDQLDCVFDCGLIKPTAEISEGVTINHRLSSTVVDLSTEGKKVYRIIREGCAHHRTIN